MMTGGSSAHLKRILAYLQMHGPCYSSEIAKALNLSPRSVGQHLKIQRKEGRVQSRPKWPHHGPLLWRLA